MAANCEKCSRPLSDRTDRFCPLHARQLLRQMRREGKLQPLSFQTQDGRVVLDKAEFLTLQADIPERETTSQVF